MLTEIQRFFLQLARDAHTGGGGAAERMVSHGRRFLEAARIRPDYLRVWLDWSTAIREETWPGYLEFQEHLVDIVADSIGSDPRHAASAAFRPEDAARLFVGNAHMAAMMYFLTMRWLMAPRAQRPPPLAVGAALSIHIFFLCGMLHDTLPIYRKFAWYLMLWGVLIHATSRTALEEPDA